MKSKKAQREKDAECVRSFGLGQEGTVVVIQKTVIRAGTTRPRVLLSASALSISNLVGKGRALPGGRDRQ